VIRPARELKYALSRHGLNRTLFVRRLTHELDHARLRELRRTAFESSGPKARALRFMFTRLERGILRVPTGRGAGLIMDMSYIPISHAHAGALASGNLESSVQEALVRHLAPGDVMYDIGANLGFFALVAARLVAAEQGRVYAFEPAPDNAEAIRRNAELNLLPNIAVIPRAVSSRAGTARLQIVDDQSWSKLEEYGEHPATERVIEVETVTIDELLRAGELPPPGLVKIDVEGAELAVLEGMRATIDEHRPVIVCELHGTHEGFAAAMAAHSYRIVNLEGPAPIAQDPGSHHALGLPPLDAGE
jgi:FkbM family methyltransferase